MFRIIVTHLSGNPSDALLGEASQLLDSWFFGKPTGACIEKLTWTSCGEKGPKRAN